MPEEINLLNKSAPTVRKVSLFKEEWIPIIKTFFVAAVPLFLGLWAGYDFHLGLISESALISLVFVVFFALQAFLVPNISLLSLLALADAASFAPMFFGSFSSNYIVAAFILLLGLLLFGARATKSAIKSSVKIVFSRAGIHAIDTAVVGIVVFLGTVYFFGGVYRFTPQAITGFVSPVVYSVKYYDPSLDLTTSTQDFLSALVRSRLPANTPPSARGSIITQLVNQISSQLEGYAGSNIDLNKTPVQNFSTILANKISELNSKTQIALNVILVIAVLLAVKSVSFILYPILSLITYLIFQLLIAFNFASMRYTQTSKETISLTGAE